MFNDQLRLFVQTTVTHFLVYNNFGFVTGQLSDLKF